MDICDQIVSIDSPNEILLISDTITIKITMGKSKTLYHPVTTIPCNTTGIITCFDN